MPAILQLDDMHTLIGNVATRHILDIRTYRSPSDGPFNTEPAATVTLYQLIPIQQHEQPFIVTVELYDDETIHRFDNQREAEAQFETETEYLIRWYDDEDEDDEDED
jgi:hypothetical protein